MSGVIVQIDIAQLAEAMPALAGELAPYLGGGGPHTHPISDVVSLQTSLDGKAASSHAHAEGDVTGLTATLAGKADSAHTHAGIPLAVHKAADQTFATTTLVDVTDLSFALVAGRHYYAEFPVVWRSNTATVGVGLSVSFPAAATFAGWVESLIAADGAGGGMQGAITASNDPVLMTAVPAINTDYVAIVKVIIVPSANGTLQLRGRNETGTTPVIIRKGSFGLLYDRGA